MATVHSGFHRFVCRWIHPRLFRLTAIARFERISSALHLIVMGLLLGMALIGRRTSRSQQATDFASIQCPNCAQPNLVEAKVCLYCGHPLQKPSLFSKSTPKQPVSTTHRPSGRRK
jgi:hypothetical protein